MVSPRLDQTAQYWLGRMEAEVIAIPDPDRAVVSSMHLAEVTIAYGMETAARAVLVQSMEGFALLHPGTWTSLLVYRAAQLCDQLRESALLEPEVRRGVTWLADPEIAKYQGGLRERVHDIALQTGQAEVARALTASDWPGVEANRLIDACRLAGWTGDVAGLRQALPLARQAIAAAEQDRARTGVGYGLICACICVGLLREAVELSEEFSYPPGVSDDLAMALWRSGDRALYTRMRDGWLSHCIEEFRKEPSNHHFASRRVRRCIEVIWRNSDVEGGRAAVQRFADVVAPWQPEVNWTACAVACDLAVLHAMVGDNTRSGELFDAAKWIFDGKVTDIASPRGSKSNMASNLSAAHRDAGNTDAALRFAKRVSVARDRRTLTISALIAGGRRDEAEGELAKVETAEDRAGLIGYTLQRMAGVAE